MASRVYFPPTEKSGDVTSANLINDGTIGHYAPDFAVVQDYKVLTDMTHRFDLDDGGYIETRYVIVRRDWAMPGSAQRWEELGNE